MARPSTRHVAIYLRISHDPTGAQVGITRQREDCTTLARARYPHLTTTEYTDNDVSAYSSRPRPAYISMLDSNPSAIIAYNLDRLLRQPRDLEALIDRGIPIITATGDLDLTTHDGQLQARILAAVAKKSSDDTSRRVTRAALSRAELGKWHGGPAPFGYRLAEHRGGDGPCLTVDRGEAEVLRQVVEQFLVGDTLASLCRVTGEHGGPATPPGLRKLLRSPALAGLTRTHDPGKWDAIIDPQVHARVQALLELRKTGHRPTPRKHWLTGLLICGKCGGKLLAQGSARYACGGCWGVVIRDSIIVPYVEGLVFEATRVTVPTTPTTPDTSFAASVHGVQEPPVDPTRLARLAELFVAGHITESEWLAGRAAALPDPSSELPPEPPAPMDPELESHWEGLSVAKKSRIARQVLDRLIVLPGHGSVRDRVQVYWRQ